MDQSINLLTNNKNLAEIIMDKEKFTFEDLEFHLPDIFKGMSKQYLLERIFDNETQENWKPKIGDVIVGVTGNIFVISSKHHLEETLGGDLFFFGGGLYNRDGVCTLNGTYSFTMNKSGKWIQHTKEEVSNSFHSSFSDFRYVPYPHEIKT